MCKKYIWEGFLGAGERNWEEKSKPKVIPLYAKVHKDFLEDCFESQNSLEGVKPEDHLHWLLALLRREVHRIPG